MYQPRRIADPIEPALGVPASGAANFDSPTGGPRRALPASTDHWYRRGSVALAVVTTAATAGAVILSNTSTTAAALGGPVLVEQPVLAAAIPAAPMAKLVAEELAAPKLVGSAKQADTAMLSLTKLYSSGSLNVRAKANSKSKLLGKVTTAATVKATTEIDGDYRKVEFEDGYGWVLADELTDNSPDGVFIDDGTVPEGTTMSACSRGSGVEGKLRKDTVHIYRSVCALFPAVNSYGGWRAGGRQFHKNGRALDIMLTPQKESALGKQIAAYLIKHAKDFNIDHIIFEQKIWTPSTPRWRHMADRGGITANHYDHVHVAIRG
ncbi:MAG TPA: hypothetical protein PLL50_05835 [Propionicimonas sp.]|nr:hypothetical protein [Propionicimonas sp.]HQA77860.1 hypothetical protein [Propionicimonas sp.]HQD96892.1 hypothetical protein [Propionicimonas sp.]